MVSFTHLNNSIFSHITEVKKELNPLAIIATNIDELNDEMQNSDISIEKAKKKIRCYN